MENASEADQTFRSSDCLSLTWKVEANMPGDRLVDGGFPAVWLRCHGSGWKLTGNHLIGISVSFNAGRSCQRDILSINERRLDRVRLFLKIENVEA